MKIAILGDGVTATAVRDACLRLGLEETDIDRADYGVASPGIPPKDYPKTQTPIIAEIELAYLLWEQFGNTPRLIGVTGTNGKTTVTALIAHLLQVPAAGNIGLPLISLVNPKEAPPAVVVELSSYQLERCFRFRPAVAVVLNLTPDHLARHGTLEAYGEAKARIFQAQTPDDVLIYYDQDPRVSDLVQSAQSRLVPFNETHPIQSLISSPALIGVHNRLNGIAACLAATELGLDATTLRDRMVDFSLPPHRLEWVLTHEGRDFYDDSKATNPDSVEVALAAFDRPVHLLLCGDDKGLDLTNFVRHVTLNAASVVVFGAIADRFVGLFEALAPTFPVQRCSVMPEAIAKAYAVSKPGDVILLSPACSSFDQFDNFNHRGDVFKALVRETYASV
ncbi:MAG: UDP-N-acetylmuramoyl-L-alanine--D-glutamate ligase [Candidatus Margulisiibacteriota bacterium]